MNNVSFYNLFQTVAAVLSWQQQDEGMGPGAAGHHSGGTTAAVRRLHKGQSPAELHAFQHPAARGRPAPAARGDAGPRDGAPNGAAQRHRPAPAPSLPLPDKPTRRLRTRPRAGDRGRHGRSPLRGSAGRAGHVGLLRR